jgi:uncharacterized protein
VGSTFQWNYRKAAENRRKHGIASEEAATVFDDPLAVTFPDLDHSENEDRWIIIGLSAVGRTLLVVHIERGRIVRIISARRADRRERKEYEEGTPN